MGHPSAPAGAPALARLHGISVTHFRQRQYGPCAPIVLTRFRDGRAHGRVCGSGKGSRVVAATHAGRAVLGRHANRRTDGTGVAPNAGRPIPCVPGVRRGHVHTCYSASSRAGRAACVALRPRSRSDQRVRERPLLRGPATVAAAEGWRLVSVDPKADNFGEACFSNASPSIPAGARPVAEPAGASADLQQKYRQFLDLLPLTISLAGLPSSEGRLFSEEQIEARAITVRAAYRVARATAKECLGGS